MILCVEASRSKVDNELFYVLACLPGCLMTFESVWAGVICRESMKFCFFCLFAPKFSLISFFDFFCLQGCFLL